MLKKRAGRAVPYYDNDGVELWAAITPEKFYTEAPKKYNGKLIEFNQQTKDFEVDDETTIIPSYNTNRKR